MPEQPQPYLVAQDKPQSIFVAKEADDADHKFDETSLIQSQDPHDPLTWSTQRKLTILVITGFWVLLGTTNMIIIGPALQIVTREFNSPFPLSTYLVGGPLLAYGVSSFFWVPLANRYGCGLSSSSPRSAPAAWTAGLQKPLTLAA